MLTLSGCTQQNKSQTKSGDQSNRFNSFSGRFTMQASCSTRVSTNCVVTQKPCGTHNHGDHWYEIGDETETVTRDCEFGPDTQDIVALEDELVCVDGLVVATGNHQRGSVLQAGQCTQTPANCGTHLHGELWWTPGTGTRPVSRLCDEDDKLVNDLYAFESQFRCFDGQVTPTQQVRLTQLVSRANCGSDVNCGIHTDGTTWFERINPLRVARLCANGSSSVDDLYEQWRELACDAGLVTPTGMLKLGERLSSGLCAGELNCGNRASGEIWLESTTDVMNETHVCRDGSTATATYKKLLQKQCDSGTVRVINENMKGDLIAAGACPLNGCGKYANGEAWFADLGKEERENISCPFGPTEPIPYVTYSVFEEQICQDGRITVGDNTVRGDKKGQVGACYACVPQSTESCPVANGSGQKICNSDGSGFGSCNLVSCQPGYRQEGNACVKMLCTPNSTRNCEGDRTNAIYEQSCNTNGSAYGDCHFVNCQPGYALVGNQCVPIICTPRQVISNGCDSIEGGINERACNDSGTGYGACVLRCTNGLPPVDNKCVSFSWQPTNAWSDCSADCGGRQMRRFVCMSNTGEVVDDSRCAAPKPSEDRICDGRQEPWSAPDLNRTTRAVCPNFGLGYIEKTFAIPVTYACVNHVKTKSYGDKRVIKEDNKCTDIKPSRCSHDSLSIGKAWGRYMWMKKCENKIPAIKELFTTIGGPEQLIFFIHESDGDREGELRPRPLYVTFATADGEPWIAPAPIIELNKNEQMPPEDQKEIAALNCRAPDGLKVLGVCTSSCYTPDQRLLFTTSTGSQSRYVPILEARDRNLPYVATLNERSTLDRPALQATAVGSFVSELVDTVHAVRTFRLASGGRLTVTVGHPIVDSEGYIREAIDFKVGDAFVSAHGKSDRVIRIEDTKYTGKVYNILPFTSSELGNIVIAEGYLNGSAYYQNDGVGFMNQKILRRSLTRTGK